MKKLYLDTNYELDCENKINYFSLLYDENSFDDEILQNSKATVSKVLKSDTSSKNDIWIKISDSLYKHIKIN